MTEAKTEHRGCSDDGMRKAKESQKRKEERTISKSVAMTVMPIGKEKNTKRMAGLG